MKVERWEGAVAGYRGFLDRFPAHPRAAAAHFRLGTSLSFAAGELGGPIAEYARAIELSPGTWVAHEAKVGLASLYCAMREYEKARALFREVLRETKDWKLVKYITYRMKELDRQMMATEQ